MLIAQATASNTASIDWALPLGFRKFRIVSPNSLPETDSAALLLRVSTDGGSTYLATGYNSVAMAAYATGHTHADGGTTGMNIDYIPGNGAGEGCSFHLSLLGAGAGEKPVMTAHACVWHSSNFLCSFVSIAHSGANDRVTHIRLLYSSGNIASGTYYLYGEE